MKRISELIVNDLVTDVGEDSGARNKTKHDYICFMFYGAPLLQKLCDILTADEHKLDDGKKNTTHDLAPHLAGSHEVQSCSPA